MQGQELTLGRTTFNSNFKTTIYPLLHPNNIDLIIHSDRWQITLNKSWILIFPLIKKTSTKHLHVMYPYNFEQPPPPLLSLIGKASFKFLLKLQLEKNNILSLQNLSSIDMDHLEMLSLSQNFITNLKPVNKTKFSNLKTVFFRDNKCHNIEISRTKSKSHLAILQISRQSSQQIKIQDPCMLVKVQAEKIRQLYLNCNFEIIFKKNVKKNLQQRFGFQRTNWINPDQENDN